MDRVRIGVIGLGWFGEIHCDAIAANPTLELAALCTRTESRLAELARKYGVAQTYTDYAELLSDPNIDAVSVVTTPNLAVSLPYWVQPGRFSREK